MFKTKFKVGDSVAIVSKTEYFDENKIARKLITYGKVTKVTKDKVVVKDHYGSIEVTKYTVLYEAVQVRDYLHELENQMNSAFNIYLDYKTLFAILKLEDD